jgi:hypothetical protein
MADASVTPARRPADYARLDAALTGSQGWLPPPCGAGFQTDSSSHCHWRNKVHEEISRTVHLLESASRRRAWFWGCQARKLFYTNCTNYHKFRCCPNLAVGHDVRSACPNDSLPRRLQIRTPPEFNFLFATIGGIRVAKSGKPRFGGAGKFHGPAAPEKADSAGVQGLIGQNEPGKLLRRQAISTSARYKSSSPP